MQPIRISDEELEYYGDRYVELRLKQQGVTFAQYLARPALYEPKALDPEPLLPAQQRVRAELAETDRLPHRDGHAIEPLHHHRHPKSDPHFHRRDS